MSSTYKTTNLELNDWLPNDTSKREDFNNDNYKIDEWAGKVNSQLKYEGAGGTATAITLNMPAILKDGYWKKFIASADNNGAATTINGKPFYKVCSTNPPNLKKDRPYEAYYNLTGDCFFLKASATGTATPEQVLANVPYSNENDTDLVGTMPNRGAVTATLNAGGSYTIPAGYHNGSGKVTANSLATQMANNGVTLTSKDQLISGVKAISKTGELLTGTATIESLGGKKYKQGTVIDEDDYITSYIGPDSIKTRYVKITGHDFKASSGYIYTTYSNGNMKDRVIFINGNYVIWIINGKTNYVGLTINKNVYGELLLKSSYYNSPTTSRCTWNYIIYE